MDEGGRITEAEDGGRMKDGGRKDASKEAERFVKDTQWKGLRCGVRPARSKTAR